MAKFGRIVELYKVKEVELMSSYRMISRLGTWVESGESKVSLPIKKAEMWTLVCT
jgi:hypothetical protein